MTGITALAWNPLVPPAVLALLAGLAVMLVALALRARGVGWRVAAAALLLTALGNPELVTGERRPLPDIALVLLDETASQQAGDRRAQGEAALAHLRAAAAGEPDLDLRVVRVGPGAGQDTAGQDTAGQDTAGHDTAGSGPVDGTRLFAALDRALAGIPADRLAGAVLITDGQIHDAPDSAALPDPGAPVHALLTGDPGAGDRSLVVVEAPRFALVGQTARVVVRVGDPAGAGGEVALTVRDADRAIARVTAVAGVPRAIDLPVGHAGPGLFEIEAAPGPAELSLDNNTAVLEINGVRDRLRVLLVSGQPHPGERTWRNLLKSDPSVDLVHFTILRPPDKQDATPVEELSLIAFPVRELFETRLRDFDLIIFDSYQRRGVLPDTYLANIADYVAAGGALLESSGASFAGPFSLYRTPLASVLPGAPTGRLLHQGFRPRLTATGERHPVTATMTRRRAPGPDGGPGWGRWFRQVEVVSEAGQILLEGAEGHPLLMLRQVGDGRVAQLASDHIWLWARQFEGGGPHAELLRRLAHWLMQEPELEADRLTASVRGDRLSVTRQSLVATDAPVTVTFPSGRRETVTLEPLAGGRSRGGLAVDEAGIYRLTDGTRSAMVAVGARNPLEFRDLAATAAVVRPVTAATGGGAIWLAETPAPALVRPARGRDMTGTAAGNRPWIGLQRNDAHAVTGIDRTPLAPWLLLLAGLTALVLAWRREGR